MRIPTLPLIVATLSLANLHQLPALAADTGFGFTVEIRTSARAAQKLAALNEKISVRSFWEGEPTRLAPKKEYADGPLTLGDEKLLLPANGGPARFLGTTVRKDRLAWARDGILTVNINVNSAYLNSKDNLLNCTSTDALLSQLQAKTLVIECRLLEGE